MFLYVYWPHNNQKNAHTLAAFKSKQKAAEFAITQLATLINSRGVFDKKPSRAALTLNFGQPHADQNDFGPVANEELPIEEQYPDFQEVVVAQPLDGVWNADVAAAPAPLRPKPAKKKEPVAASPEFIALKKEIMNGENSKTFDNANRLISLFESYQTSVGRKSVLHSIKEVKIIDEVIQ